MDRQRLGISVRDALQLEAFKDVRVIAGHKGLDRKILHINVMEVPDIVNWVREGELLFTTLYSIREDPEKQVKLIPELAEKKLAGLAIKPKRFINNIPAEAIEKANALSFPLLQIPPEASFAEMIEPLLNEIFDFQTDLLHQSELMHNKLLNVVLKGGTLPEIAAVLEEILDCKVAIMNTNFNILAPTESEPPDVSGLFVHGEDSYAGQSQMIKSVIAVGRHLGYIAAFGKGEGFSVIDEITLERAATIVALEIVTQLSLEEVKRRYRNEFVVGLLAGTFFSEKTARQRARNNGWELQEQMRVLVFRIDEHPDDVLRDRLFRYFSEHFGASTIFGEVGQDIVLLLPIENECCQDLNCLDTHLVQIQRLVEKDIVLGIGRQTKSIRNIPASFRQANIAVRLAKKVPSLGPIVHYDQLGVYRLLDELDSGEIAAFVSDTLQPLLDYEHKLDLLNTLEHYFASGGNISQVAKNMYVHYNTVVYRLERIEQLLEVKLANPEHRLSIEIALKAREFLADTE